MEGAYDVIRISQYSSEYVRVRVEAEKAGVDFNPTADAVVFAFPVVGADPDTWYAATWETEAGTPPRYHAMCLVGTTAILTEGTYDVYVKVTDDPEIPVKRVGQVAIF